MATYHLQIVTPDRPVYDGQAQELIVRTIAGDVCILANHIDYASALGDGICRIVTADGDTRSAACHGGLLSVRGGEVRLMAITFEWSDEIDVDRASRAKERAEEMLANLSHDDQDYAIASARLRRALARIQASN